MAWTGSAFCPQDHLVRRLFRSLPASLKVRPVDDVRKLVRRWNALAALLHLLTVMLCGLRNNPIDGIPASLIGPVSMDFMNQKEHDIAYRLPDKLKRMLKAAQEIWSQVRARIEDSGGMIVDDDSQGWAYGFLQFKSSTEYRYMAPSYAMVREGLAGSKALETFVLWRQRAWPRHWSNTIFREHGFNEIEVRAFHWHHKSSLHPERRHRMEPLLSERVLAPMIACLWKALGL